MQSCETVDLIKCQVYGRNMVADVQDDTSGNYQRLLLTLLEVFCLGVSFGAEFSRGDVMKATVLTP